jgi:hypothetical protein
MVEKIQSPKPVIVKTMIVNRKTSAVHNFFEDMKYMEISGAVRSGSLKKGNDGWWTFLLESNVSFVSVTGRI